VEGGICHIATL